MAARGARVRPTRPVSRVLDLTRHWTFSGSWVLRTRLARFAGVQMQPACPTVEGMAGNTAQSLTPVDGVRLGGWTGTRVPGGAARGGRVARPGSRRGRSHALGGRAGRARGSHSSRGPRRSAPRAALRSRPTPRATLRPSPPCRHRSHLDRALEVLDRPASHAHPIAQVLALQLAAAHRDLARAQP